MGKYKPFTVHCSASLQDRIKGALFLPKAVREEWTDIPKIHQNRHDEAT